MQTVTRTLTVSDDLARRLHAVSPETISHYAEAALPGMLNAAEYETAADPVNPEFIAELAAADKEAARTGNAGDVTLEAFRQQLEIPDASALMKQARIRLAAEGRTAAEMVGGPVRSAA